MVTNDTEIPHQATSPGGTPIAYGSVADHHQFAAPLPHLTPHAQVTALDRRGRGDCGDSPEYAPRVHVLPGQSHVADQREPEAFARLLLDFLRSDRGA